MRAVTMAVIMGEASDSYLMAAEALDRPSDAVADCLRADPLFDLRAVWAFHDLLASHYRSHVLDGRARQAEGWISGHVGRWMLWAEVEAQGWLRRRPRLLRALLPTAIQADTAQGYLAEMDLWDEAVRAYPVAGAKPTR